MNKTKNILICNDDGADASGLYALIEIARDLGNVIVVVPEFPQSGMSHSITISKPLRAKLKTKESDYEFYTVPGTPADCIKIALNRLCKTKPDIVVSGVNHGSNSAISVIYSGTMGAAIEAALYGIPAIGLSILDYSAKPDFSIVKEYGKKIITTVLENGLPHQVSLNVNFPVCDRNSFNGFKICKQTQGVWNEHFDTRIDPYGNNYYWLTGVFKNEEPNNTNTDEWALENNFASIVPIKPNLTDIETLNIIKKWNLENE
ncbi:MAG TPA: 5'/3'-nucleotidase SurE [Bacteroidales bacterium]|nr:5'/3'-nucleotidase SurE [Bacteroidales bacterium]MDY0161334.1 5'/3'-nucleotidase SurE [Bacteroidales bacterium]HXK81412.1 5'/3'-nucleotidase SurE [Bacteroidales bacterium]